MIVEDSIVQAFASLNIQMLMYVDVRTVEEHPNMIDEGKKIVEQMPAIFVFGGGQGVL